MELYKFTLSSKKEIYLREPLMDDTESCIQIAGMKAGDNMALLGVITQKEMFKKLLVKVDNNVLTMVQKEDLKSMFSFKEWSQCIKALKKLTDEDQGNDLTPEFVLIGDK